MEDAIQGKQPTITTSTDLTSNSITLPTIGDVEDAIQGKQDTILANGLTITQTAGLQDALDNKYDDTGGTISGSVDITGDLVVGTTNIISEIGTKQDEITTTTDLSCNSLNTHDLIVNESLNVDDKIVVEDQSFNTLVFRRPDLTSSSFDYREIQVWVSGVNILATNSSTLEGYFAD